MKRLAWPIVCLIAHLIAAPVLADPAHVNLLDGIAWTQVRPADGDAAFRTVTSSDDGKTEIEHIQVNKASDPFWLIMISKPIAKEIPEGNRFHLTFWARSSTHNHIRAVVEHTSAPYTSAALIITPLGDDWQQFNLSANSPGYPAGGLSVRLQVGFEPGIIELKNVTFEDDGPDPAYVDAEAAIAPDAVAKRIEKYRKADLRITVEDQANRPIQGATVTVKMVRHSFLFGCNLFLLDPNDHSPLQQAYQERFGALFNYATLPFYWGSYEPARGQTNDAKLMAMAQWCLDKEITAKGHPLVYHQVYPKWAARDADGAIARLQFRVQDVIERYRGKIGIWDVVNEANGSAWATDNGIGAWARRDGAATMVATALGWARAAGAGSKETFIYNDYETGQPNMALLDALAKRKALPDVVGIQSHMHTGEWKPMMIWLNAERFSSFGRPVHFTETTVLSGEHRPMNDDSRKTPWPSTPDGEAAQADYLVRFYSILFSHPRVQAITYWDLSDHNAWLGAPAGLLRGDMSPKPSYTLLMELIHKTWWTDAMLDSDLNGMASVRGFCGDYELTAVTADGRKATVHCTLAEGSDPTEIIIRIGQ